MALRLSVLQLPKARLSIHRRRAARSARCMQAFSNETSRTTDLHYDIKSSSQAIRLT